MDGIKTAAAYIRVSDERQDEYSPDSQLKNIRAYCKQNGYILPEQYVFYDDGISGRSTKKRSQFRELIGLAKDKEHPIDAILVWKFSRFARNQEESIVYKSALQKIGVDVISISEPLPDGPFGTLVERMIEWMDEYYSIRLSDEVRRGMLEKVSRGEPICAPAYGYDIRDKHYYPNEDQAAVVREVFDLYLSGTGKRAIAQILGARGLLTRFGKCPDNRFVEYMLHNPVYIGKIRFCTNGNSVSRGRLDDPNIVITDGVHDPIISMDVWERTQEKLREEKIRYAKNARRDPVPPTYAFRSLFRCSCCGATLVRISTASPALQCHNYARGQCTRSHSITLRRAQAALIDALQFCADNRTFQISAESISNSSPDTATIDAKIKAEQRRLQRAKDAYQAGVDTLDEYSSAKIKITATIEALQKEKETLCAPVLRSDDDKVAMIRNAVSLLQDSTAEESVKNQILVSLLDKVIYHADTRSIDVYFRP